MSNGDLLCVFNSFNDDETWTSRHYLTASLANYGVCMHMRITAYSLVISYGQNGTAEIKL